jgi:hypothetical protein
MLENGLLLTYYLLSGKGLSKSIHIWLKNLSKISKKFIFLKISIKIFYHPNLLIF